METLHRIEENVIRIHHDMQMLRERLYQRVSVIKSSTQPQQQSSSTPAQQSSTPPQPTPSTFTPPQPTPSTSTLPECTPSTSTPPSPVISRRRVAALFTCLICHESRPNRYYSCPFTGTYIGCYDCIVPRCNRCPLCYRTLPTNPPPVPLLIPGAGDVIDIPDVEEEEEGAEDTELGAQSFPLPPP